MRSSFSPREVSREKSASGESRRGLDSVVASLRKSREEAHNIRHGGLVRKMPSRVVLATVAEQIATALFPTHHGALDVDEDKIDGYVAGILSHALNALGEQVRLDLARNAEEGAARGAARAAAIVEAFAAQLPDVRGLLVGDLRAAYESDPAATSYPEILLGYPGMTAILYHRLAHVLFRFGAKLSARLIASHAHSKTAVDIHPGAEIGPEFFIDHGTGVVIGETAIVGRRVRLHQGVTLGALPADAAALKGVPRHPVVEDDVVIYPGATVLGRVTIGKGAVVGGNVWLTQSVPPGSRITQAALRGNAD